MDSDFSIEIPQPQHVETGVSQYSDSFPINGGHMSYLMPHLPTMLDMDTLPTTDKDAVRQLEEQFEENPHQEFLLPHSLIEAIFSSETEHLDIESTRSALARGIQEELKNRRSSLVLSQKLIPILSSRGDTEKAKQKEQKAQEERVKLKAQEEFVQSLGINIQDYILSED